MSIYERMIVEQLGKLKRLDIKPSQVEAYMRLQYGTLDHLDRRTFNKEVKIAIGCIDSDPRLAEDMVRMEEGTAFQ